MIKPDLSHIRSAGVTRRTFLQGTGAGLFVLGTSCDLALSQKLLDNKLRLGFRVSDVFDQRGFHITRTDPQFDLAFSRKPTSRTAMLTASYTFGTPDRNARRRVPTGNQEPEGGAGGGW